MSKPTLASGIPLEDLYLREGLVHLDRVFLAHLRQASAKLHQRLVVARSDPSSLTEKARSELMIELAPYLEDFLAEQFGIAQEVAELQARHHELASLYAIKRKFVQRRAISGVAPEQAAEIDGEAVARELERFGAPLTERVFVERVSQWLEREPEFAAEIGLAARYAA